MRRKLAAFFRKRKPADSGWTAGSNAANVRLGVLSNQELVERVGRELLRQQRRNGETTGTP